MRIAFVLNPVSGPNRSSESIEKILPSMFSRGGHHARVWKTERRGHGFDLARAAATEGYDVVVAVGGDGTVNEVARAVMGTPSCLGIVPMGSGNGLAREFGIPLQPLEAARALVGYRRLDIDVGRVNGECFFNVSGFGLDARIAREFDRSFARGGRRGLWPYFKWGFREYLRYRPSSVVLRHDGGETSVTPLLVALANAKHYGGGARIAPNAVVNDGWLDVVVVENGPWWRVFQAFLQVFGGRFTHHPLLVSFLTRTLDVDFGGGEIDYHLDGEPRRACRLEVDLLPGALGVLVPGGYSSPTITSPNLRDRTPFEGRLT